MDIEDRKSWFHECHLRQWNIESFRSGAGAGFFKNGGQMPDKLPDNLKLWDCSERHQRDAFRTTFLGVGADWVDYKETPELIAALGAARDNFHSGLANIDAKPAPDDSDVSYRPRDTDQIEHAISRIE